MNPVSYQQPGAVGEQLAAPREFANARVALIGERSPVMPELARALQRAGIIVVERSAAAGPEAAEQQSELAFLDLRTAPLQAVASATTLRHRGLRGPMIGVSEGRCPVPGYTCFNAGIDDVLELPLDEDTLWGCLTRWLRPRG